jgi:hypothetical protein
MTVRSQRYIISPARACPPHLRIGSGRPPPRVELDMDDVARAAWGEILQTAPASSSLFAFLEDLLQPGSDLIWRGSGPGRGTEMRRSFSGLFGRFFARAYLEVHHDFVWFAAIDGDEFHLSPHWRVKRFTKAEMPDWICAKPGELSIGEAKGSHQKGNATGATRPGPIRTAEGQITGVRVQKRTRTVRGLRWHSRSVKGWAVMSRWGLAAPPRAPFLYALDPKTDGDELTDDERDDLIQAVARTHVEQTALGLGLLKQADDETLSSAPRSRVRVADDPEKRLFTGAVISPFGFLDLDLAQAKSLSALLPDPKMLRFVGIEQGLFESFLQGQPLQPRQRQRIGDRAVLGSDGLVVAPVEQAVDLGLQADGA